MATLRKCGACTLCCTTVGVPELAKEPGEVCVHLTARGCGIYEERPESCRQFDCSWLKGRGDLSVRPDRTGVVLGGTTDGRTNLLFMRVGEETKWDRSAYVRKEVRAALKARHPVVIVAGPKRVQVKLG